MDRLRDKVAIVTGGAQGLGEGIARRLAEEGASVVIADINGAKAKSVADSLTQEGKQAIAVTLDVAERKQVQEAIQTTVDRFGRLDVMFNNAGFNKPVPFMDVDEDNLIERVGRDWARRRSAPAPAGSPRKARRLANVRRSASKPRWMRSESCAFLGVSNVSSGLIAIPDLARPSRAGQKRSDDSPALRAIGWASASWRFGSRPQGSSTLGGAIHV
jgi:short chain dehydrogenase